MTATPPTAEARTDPLPPATQALQLGLKAATAYGREDLAARLSASLSRVTDPRLQVLIVGEFKQGKSSLINALLNAPVCPVDDDVATSVPTAVSFGEPPRAVVYPADDAGGSAGTGQAIPLEALADYVSEAGNPGNHRRLARAEVSLPRQLLRSGLVLVDTPGVGGLGSTHSATTLGVLPSADAVVLVSDAAQEYTRPELDFLGIACDLSPNVACVLTKTDLYPEWRRVLALSRADLDAEGIDAPILPTSATLRTEALRLNDTELHDESGYPALLAYLHDEIVGKATVLATRAAGHDLMSVSNQLAGMFAAEREALADPERAQALVADLARTKERADHLRSQAAQWQQTLSDGFGDLQSDCEHDLRHRMRVVGRDADEALDAADPGEVWEQFEAWLYQRVTSEVAESYTRMTHGTRALAEEVATHFADDGAEVTTALPRIATPEAALEQIDVGDKIEATRAGIGERAMTALRGSYGGVLMFGMLGGLVGMAMLNPVSLLMGAKMGHKALKDERERALSARRSQGKAAARRYVDEVTFQVSKDLRDTLRHVQRSLRDEFTARADELKRSVGDSLEAAQATVKQDQAERQQRLADIDAELTRIRSLQQTAEHLTRAGATPAGRP